MKIKVLGSGCPTCEKLHQVVEQVAQKIDSNIEVEYIDDIAKLVELGAMSSPALVINDKLIFSGKVPSSEEIEEIITTRIECCPDGENESSDGDCCCGEC